MSMNGTEHIQVKYKRDNAYGFVKDQIYDAFRAKSKFGNTEMICILDENGEEYAYPAVWFDILEPTTNNVHNVYIISGAPASGKTTYVQNKRKQGDLVFDLDAICAALGGTSELYEDHKPYLDTALRVRDVIYEQIEKRTGKWHDAYVITASNDSKFVEALAERLNGTVIAMKATREQCIKQAKKDKRRQANIEKQIEIINEWFDKRS